MKHRTKISWCDFTVNWWEGCTKVSAGCALCYAEHRNQRWHHGANWGKGAERRLQPTFDNAARSLRSINRRFSASGDLYMRESEDGRDRWIHGKEDPPTRELGRTARVVRPQIFSLSLGDILDPEVPVSFRARALLETANASNCEFLLLTKRPEQFHDQAEEILQYMRHQSDCENFDPLVDLLTCGLPHVAWGTSVEDDRVAERIPHLERIPAPTRFLSCEPLLGRVDLMRAIRDANKIGLIITGGESGVKARPMHPAWPHAIDRQAKALGIRHHFKQWGTWAPREFVQLSEAADNPGNIRTAVDPEAGYAETDMARIPRGRPVEPKICDDSTWYGPEQSWKTLQPRLRFPFR